MGTNIYIPKIVKGDGTLATQREKLNRFQASRKPGSTDVTIDSKWSDKAAMTYDSLLPSFQDPQGLESKFHGPGLSGDPDDTRTAFVEMATEASKGRQHHEWMRAQHRGAERDPAMQVGWRARRCAPVPACCTVLERSGQRLFPTGA